MSERTKTILYTVLGVFFVSVATAYLNAGGDLFHMTTEGWQSIVNAGIASVLVFGIAMFAPPVAKKLGIGKQ